MSAQQPRTSTARPHFLTLNGRRLFALQIVPTGPCKGAVLYLPPFAEEMNRCRSHAASQARALAADGYSCLLLDPFGTGESDGEFSDPSWSMWQDDAAAAAQWLHRETGLPLTLWGVRTGALLAADVADSAAAPVDRLLFWQPVLDGALFLTQHLRLRVASLMVHQQAERETTDTIKARLAAGEVVEIAGYPLANDLASSLAQRRLAANACLRQIPTAWLEMVAKPEQPLAVASRKLLDNLAAAGAPAVRTQVVACPLIWQLQEREDAPALLDATRTLLGGMA